MKRGESTMEVLITLIVIIIVFTLIVTGIVDKLAQQLLIMNYHVDLTQTEACHDLYDDKLGNMMYADLLTDQDHDEMFDYVCDTCTCRDGYKGKLCLLLNQGLGSTPIEEQLRTMFGMSTGTVIKKEKPRCQSKTDSDSCQTDNLNDYDLDDDLLPDICDDEPTLFDKKPKCYTDVIWAVDEYKNEKVIGYVHPEKFITTASFQCVFVLCTDKAVFFDNPRYFKRFCIDGYMEIDENDLIWHGADEIEELIDLYG